MTPCYRPQRSWAKVMFLQASLILSTGGSASVHAGIYPPDQRPTLKSRHPPPKADTYPFPGPGPPGVDTHPPTHPGPDPPPPPPGSRLQHTVNERSVRILLECILVRNCYRPQTNCWRDGYILRLSMSGKGLEVSMPRRR